MTHSILDQMRDCRVKQRIKGGTTYLSKEETIKWLDRLSSAERGQKKVVYDWMIGLVPTISTSSACQNVLKKFNKRYNLNHPFFHKNEAQTKEIKYGT